MRLALPFTAEHPVLSTVAFCLLLPLLLTQLLVFIRRHNIQLVNLHYPMASFLLFAICCRVASIKLVTSIHGADIFPRGRRREKYHIGLRYLLRSSDLIVANSRAFREDFLAVFPQLDKKTTAIHNGVNAEEFYGCDRLQPGKYGRYVLCIAAHNEKKALDVLLRAFVEITAVDKDLKLILVGDGPLRPQLQDLAASLHLNGQVRFVGAQGREEVARLLHGCEIFVLPSRSEPFGIAVIEAMPCRKPVVAAASGGIPEIIEDGRSGILVKPDDPPQLAAAMKRLLDNQDFQRTIGENGYTRAIGHFLCRGKRTGPMKKRLNASSSRPTT